MPRNKPNGKKRLTDKQMKIARVAEPRDRITAADFTKLRKKIKIDQLYNNYGSKAKENSCLAKERR